MERGRGRGRGDFGERGRGRDVGGRPRGGRDIGGRGRGEGRGGGRDFGGGAPARFAPDREAEMGTPARPGRRYLLKTAEDAEVYLAQQLTTFDEDIRVIGTQPNPRRPGYGRRGRPVKIRTNHYKVECRLRQAVHYDVLVEGISRVPESERRARAPRPLPPEVFREVMRALSEKEHWQPGWVFDGMKNMYAPTMFLPQHETTYEVQVVDPDSGRTRDFKVTIKWAANVNIGELLEFLQGRGGPDIPQDAIQALDVALKHSTLMNPSAVCVARAFFFPDPSSTRPLTGGAEVWLGYRQSLRPCETGLTLNVDIACTAFLAQMPCVDFLAQSAGVAIPQLSNINGVQLRKAIKAISGLKVELLHLRGRKMKVKGLSKESARDLKFDLQENDHTREVTVEQYYKERYNVELKFPNLKCLNVGSPARPIYVPPELAKIAKGQRRLKLDERQTAEMIKTAAKKPHERIQAIENSVKNQAKLPTDPNVHAFGMKIDPQLLTVEARILDPPVLQYATPFKTPNTGDWNLRGVRFNTGASLKSYAVASFAPPNRVGRQGDPGSIMAFVSELVAMLRKCGLTAPDPMNLPEVIFHNPNSSFPGTTLKAAVDAGKEHFRNEPQIIFVLLPDTGAELYKEVKRATDSFLGIPSQCFVQRKASIGVAQTRPRDQYTANLALKINVKLNGKNVILPEPQPWQKKPYMILGADVTHPMAGIMEPSIAAVVGSIDYNAQLYASDIQLQGHRIEMIQDLKNIAKRLLKAFYMATGKKKPERIVMFRDGVSEGQFAEVKRTEVTQLIAACRELGRSAGEEYAPAVTFVVVQKGHHTRFFPTDRNTDRSGNCMPGTVLDRGVVHPTDYSFFLQSHAGLQGTSRPAHYHVLLDQIGFGPDDLQAYIYHLCYTFCRCTRSVSVCPPAYYAHLAAFRGRCLLSHFEPSDSETGESFPSGPVVGTHAEFAVPNPKLANRMFYV